MVQSVGAGRDDVQLQLRPVVGASPGDIEGAEAILDEAWQTSRGSKFTERASLPVTLAPYAPDAALEMVGSGERQS